MKHLLDVNLLLAAIWRDHPQHARAFGWLDGQDIGLCPIAELGFLRISTHKKAINATMDAARNALKKFIAERGPERIADDLPALDSHPGTSEQVTDHYLADLAAQRGWKLATLDEGIKHSAVLLVPASE